MTRRESLIELLVGKNSNKQHLFAVVDGARLNGQLYDQIERHISVDPENTRCLFDGDAYHTMGRGGPWVLRPQIDSPFTQAWFQRGLGDAWGIFIYAATSELTVLKHHLKRLLTVTLPAEQNQAARQALYRFYDPRVLHATLPVFLVEQQATMFGDVIRAFAAESSTQQQMTRFTWQYPELLDKMVGSGRLVTDTFDLPQPTTDKQR